MTDTGAIAGGVVGGVVALLLIIGALVFFLKKRRRSHREDFDDMMVSRSEIHISSWSRFSFVQFDPSRAQNHAQVDLADPGTNTVEPYYAPGVASTGTSPEMSRHPRSAATTSDGVYSAVDLSRNPSSATSAGYAGRGAGGYPLEMSEAPRLPPIPAGAVAGGGLGAGAGAAMSAKQREAYDEQQRFHVANQNQGGQGPQGGHGYDYGHGGPSGGPSAEPLSPTETSRTGVTVHEDAGAADQSEIPPTWVVS